MAEQIKNITRCYIYSKSDNYTKQMTDAIMKSERINQDSKIFMEDVALEIKRSKAPLYAMKILLSKNTHFIYPVEPLPRPLRLFGAKDIKNKGSKINIFIDCTNIITKASNDRYKCKVDTLTAYLINAKNTMVYYALPGKLSGNSGILKLSTGAFAKLFTHVIDYIGNISVIPENRDKLLYLSGLYFLKNVFGITDEERVKQISTNASGITETQQRIFDISLDGQEYESLPALVETVKNVFKLDKITLNLVLEKWMFLYGAGTVLALEFLPTFLAMITDAYCGVYLNNQKSIEKILDKNLVELGKLCIYENFGI